MTDQRKLRLLWLMEQANTLPGTQCSVTFAKHACTVHFYQFEKGVSMVFDYDRIFMHLYPRIEPLSNQIIDTPNMDKAEEYILRKLKEGGIEIA